MTLTLFMWLSHHDTTILHDNLVISYLDLLCHDMARWMGITLFIGLHDSYSVVMCPPSTFFYISRVFSIYKYLSQENSTLHHEV